MNALSRAVRHPAARWIWAALLVAALAVLPFVPVELPGIMPGAFTKPGTLQLLSLCLVFAGLALTYHVLFGVTGLLSFGHTLYFAIGAYGLGLVLEHASLDLLPAIGLTVVAALVAAVVLGAISLRVTGISFAMVTLAFGQAGTVLIQRNSTVTGGEEGLTLATEHVPTWLLGVVNTKHIYWIALALVVLVFLAIGWFEQSRAGHAAKAVRENELRVRVLGLPPYPIKLIALVIGSTLAAVIGMLYLVLQSGTTPRAASSDLTLTVLVMVVLGGVGSRWGAVVGAVVYTILDQRLTELAGSDAIAALPPVLRIPLSEPLFLLGTLFILVVLFLPGGIVGLADRIGAGRRRRPQLREMDE